LNATGELVELSQEGCSIFARSILVAVLDFSNRVDGPACTNNAAHATSHDRNHAADHDHPAASVDRAEVAQNRWSARTDQ
jgi:hypothetical protein